MASTVRVKMTPEQKVAALQKKIRQVKALDEKQKLRELGDVIKKSSAQETRKKILIGAFVLSHMDAANLRIGNVSFLNTLVREDDRKLFGLPPIQPDATPRPAPPTPKSPAPVASAAGFSEDALARTRRLAAEREAAAGSGSRT